MDYEYVNRLRKKIEDLYKLKYTALINAKEYGEMREHQGFIKAIAKIGELIDSNEGEAK